MKLNCKQKNAANATIEGVIAKDYLENKIEAAANKLAREVKLDGFRKGKVPATVVKNRFKDKLTEDARQELITEVLNTGLKDLKIDAKDIIGQPVLSKYEESGNTTDIEIQFCTRPTIALKGFEDLVPELVETEVSEKEVEERIKELARASAPLEKFEGKRGLKNGDFANIDFESFDGETPVANGKLQDFTVEVGTGRFMAEFEKELVGIKDGATKEFTVNFPDEHQNKALAGKEIKFIVKLNGISVKPETELNDELALKLMPNDKEANFEKLQKVVKESIEQEKTAKLLNETLKPQLIEALVAKFSFDLPELIVEQELDLLVRGKVQLMLEDEIKELQEDEKKVKKLRESLKPDAEKSVKATFLIDELAKIEKVTVDDNELVTAVYYEAVNSGSDPKQLFEYYRDSGLLPAIKMALIEDKLLAHLIDKKKKGAA